jgi:hypothetical protein
MTDRKWRIIQKRDKKSFYTSVEKYEKLGYKLHPDSFGFATSYAGTGHYYYALMSKKE